MKTNNVTRLLEAHQIPYTAHELPSQKLGAQAAAAHLGVPPDQVFKTIVLVRTGRGKPILAVTPGDREVDLKAVAQVVGEKKVSVPTQQEAERLTRLQAGGISPLALINRGFEVLLDAAALEHTTIFISAGQRGLNVQLPPQALVQLTGAQVANISQSATP